MNCLNYYLKILSESTKDLFYLQSPKIAKTKIDQFE